MFCSARTRIHLRADNGPWKENYNQSRGRKEGTAHPLQPNILIYKESIKYLKSKVASQSARWWLDWGISVYLLPYSIPPVHFHIAPSFHLSVHFCFFFVFFYVFIISEPPPTPLSLYFISCHSVLISFTLASLSFAAPPTSVNVVAVNRYSLT